MEFLEFDQVVTVVGVRSSHHVAPEPGRDCRWSNSQPVRPTGFYRGRTRRLEVRPPDGRPSDRTLPLPRSVSISNLEAASLFTSAEFELWVRDFDPLRFEGVLDRTHETVSDLCDLP